MKAWKSKLFGDISCLERAISDGHAKISDEAMNQRSLLVVIAMQGLMKLSLKSVIAFLIMASSAQGQNLFVANYGNNTISEITPGGGVFASTFASGVSAPYGLAFDSAGDLFVANEGMYGAFSGTITEITPGGTQSTFASYLSAPIGLAFNSAGDLFEADSGSGNIYEFAPGGGVIAIFASGLSAPYGLAFNSAGNLFVSNFGKGTISVITPGGVVESTFGVGFNGTAGLAFDSAGNLFVVNDGSGVAGAGSIAEITPGGVESTFASGLSYPSALAFDSAGDLFVANGSNNPNNDSISEFTPGGAESIYYGVSSPTALAFQGETLPVPEPSASCLLALGVIALLVRRRRGLWLTYIVVPWQTGKEIRNARQVSKMRF